MLVVCPAGLQAHWRDQMRDKFGLEFRIGTASQCDSCRSRGIHANPWSHFCLITSVDFLKREGPMRHFREAVPDKTTYPRRFDILIVDEAHNVAPQGHGLTALDSQRTQAIRDQPAFRAQALPDRHPAQRLPGKLLSAAGIA